MAEIITLLTNRLLIRDLNWNDLNFIHSLHSIPSVQEYATLTIPKSLAESKEYLENYIVEQQSSSRKEYGFCISLIDHQPIGLIGLSNNSSKFRKAELWFKLAPEYWGKGYTTEAANMILKLGFEELALHRIEAGVDTENLASIKILEKIGMRREGLRRKILPIRGQWKDNFHYAILEEDFFNLNKNLTIAD